jgi:hypothetical protein
MRAAFGLCLSIVVAVSGCANLQLRHSTVRQASTITDLQYQQVLNNLAMISGDREALPWALTLKAGSTQFSDSGTVSGSVTVGGGGARGPIFGLTTTVVDQWGTVPVTDDNTLLILSYAYQNAFGAHRIILLPEANDMAFDFATQMGTNADISTDSDTLKAMLSLTISPQEDWSKRREEERKAVTEQARVNAAVVSNMGGLCQTVGREFRRQFFDEGWSQVFLRHSQDIGTLGDRLLRLADEIEKAENKIYLRFYEKAVRQISQSVSTLAAAVKSVNDRVSNNQSMDQSEKITNSNMILEQIRIIRETINLLPSEKRSYVPSTDEQERFQAYDRARSQITSTLDKDILVQGTDGLFATKNDRATGLAKAATHKMNDVQKTLIEIEHGWFGVGRRSDVPHDACYVGSYRSCRQCRFQRLCDHCTYVWVCENQRAQLAKFTRQILKLSSEFKEAQLFNVPSGIQFSPAYSTPR